MQRLPNINGFSVAKQSAAAEAERCEIPQNKEANALYFEGKIRKFKFLREDNCWIVEGPLELSRAIKLASIPASNAGLRPLGMTNSVVTEDSDLVTRVNPQTGQHVISHEAFAIREGIINKGMLGDHAVKLKAQCMASSDPKSYPGFVMRYCVDSELALYLLVKEICAQGSKPTFNIL